MPLGEGRLIPSGYFSNLGKSSLAYRSGMPVFGSSYNTHKIFIFLSHKKNYLHDHNSKIILNTSYIIL